MSTKIIIYYTFRFRVHYLCVFIMFIQVTTLFGKINVRINRLATDVAIRISISTATFGVKKCDIDPSLVVSTVHLWSLHTCVLDCYQRWNRVKIFDPKPDPTWPDGFWPGDPTRSGRWVFFLFLPRDASAERGDATVSRPSVCLSVCPSVRLSVTIRYRDHIGWNSSKIISRPLRPMRSLTSNMGDLVQREHPKIRVE